MAAKNSRDVFVFYSWDPEDDTVYPDTYNHTVRLDVLTSPDAVKEWVLADLSDNMEPTSIEDGDNVFIEVVDAETYEVYFSDIIKFVFSVTPHVNTELSKLLAEQRKLSAEWRKERLREAFG